MVAHANALSAPVQIPFLLLRDRSSRLERKGLLSNIFFNTLSCLKRLESLLLLVTSPLSLRRDRHLFFLEPFFLLSPLSRAPLPSPY